MNFIFGYCGEQAKKTKREWTLALQRYFDDKIVELHETETYFFSEILLDNLAESSKVKNNHFFKSSVYTSGFMGRRNLDKQTISVLSEEEKVNLYDTVKANPHCYSEITGNYLLFHFTMNKIRVINDYYGTQPLYYHKSSEGFYFANNILLLLIYSKIPFCANIDACKLYCSAYFSVDESSLNGDTFFESIRRVPPSSILEIKGGNFSILSLLPCDYISIVDYLPDDGLNDSFDMCVLRFRNWIDLLTDFSYKNMGNKVVGVSLSGGIDSSVVLAALVSCGLSKHAICYNLSFRTKELYHCSDSLLVDEIVKKTGVEAYIIYGDDTLRINNADFGRDAIVSPNGPTCLGNESFYYTITNLLNQRGSTLLYGGDGGDFLFSGTKYCGDYYMKHHGLKGALKRSNYLSCAENTSKLYSFFHYNILPLLPFFSNKAYKDIFWSDVFCEETPLYMSDEVFKIDSCYRKNKDDMFLNSKFLGNWYRRYMYDFMFPRGEYVDIQFGNSFYYQPLMDINTFLFAMTVPPWMHYDIKSLPIGNYGARKQLLRRAYADILPSSIVNQSNKTLYGSMMSLSIRNDSKHIKNMFWDTRLCLSEDAMCIKKKPFLDKLCSILNYVNDPHFLVNDELHRVVNIIRLEIWLKQVDAGRDFFIKESLRNDFSISLDIERVK